MFPKDENGKFYYSDVDYLETWQGMEEAVSRGLVRSIGLSNFNSQQIERVLASCTIRPAALQVNLQHLHDKQNNLHLTNLIYFRLFAIISVMIGKV